MNNNNRHHCILKDSAGNYLHLSLIKKETFKDDNENDKNYALYTIVKVLEDLTYVELYDETFTSSQVDDFYNKPTHYIPIKPNKLILSNGGKIDEKK